MSAGSRAEVNTRRAVAIVALGLAVCLSGCAKRAPAPDAGAGRRILEIQQGLASWYGQPFHGRLMASGRRFDMNALVAAHPSYPFGTEVRVTNLKNGRSVKVRILDRGPTRPHQADGVIIDLSRGAARRLGFIREGRARVRVEVLRLGGH